MRKIILIVHISLDGYVAGAEGELDGFDASAENLEFVCKLTEGADAALFGRTSFRMLDDYWPYVKNLPDTTKEMVSYSNWYNQAKKIVLSKTMKSDASKKVTVISENIKEEMVKIKNEEGKDILIFGSPVATRSLMDLDLIDIYWIFVNPILFGQGVPLFLPSTIKRRLKLRSTKSFANGELGIEYSVDRGPSHRDKKPWH
jgi:dihydrofolate reductase